MDCLLNVSNGRRCERGGFLEESLGKMTSRTVRRSVVGYASSGLFEIKERSFRRCGRRLQTSFIAWITASRVVTVPRRKEFSTETVLGSPPLSSSTGVSSMP